MSMKSKPQRPKEKRRKETPQKRQRNKRNKSTIRIQIFLSILTILIFSFISPTLAQKYNTSDSPKTTKKIKTTPCKFQAKKGFSSFPNMGKEAVINPINPREKYQFKSPQNE